MGARRFLWIWAALFALSICYALGTPLGSAPDEPSHIIKAAAVAHGELIGTQHSGSPDTIVLVPAAIANAQDWPCNKFVTSEPASCMPPFHSGMAPTKALTSAGLYNPVYYWLVGWPSLLSGNAQVIGYGMRMVSALLITACLAVAFTALSRLKVFWLAKYGFFAALTPMVYYLAGSVNPNSLEIAAGICTFATLLLVASHDHGPSKLEAGIIAASAVLLVTSRGISPLWLALMLGVVVALTPARRMMMLLKNRRMLIAAGIALVATVGSVVWTLYTGSLGSLAKSPGVGSSPAVAFISKMISPVDPTVIGVFGWLDAPAPESVIAVWITFALAGLVVALGVARGRNLVALLVSVAGIGVLPALVQAASVRNTGYVWQGRYSLLAFGIFLITCSVVVARESTTDRVSPRMGWLVVSIVAIAQTWSFVTVMTRNAVGGTNIFHIVRPAAWSPPGGVALWILLAAVASTAVSIVVVLARNSASRGELPGRPDITSGTIRS
nr:DUF2142 domain-containing protein [Planctomonas sp. JC2975]